MTYPAWLCIPAARDGGDSTVSLWRAQGYGIALWRDVDAAPIEADIVFSGVYPGYYRSINHLIQLAVTADVSCQWFVAGGDDVKPDPRFKADDLTARFTALCGGTFAVVQPTGDRGYGDRQGPYIDRIAGSPWLGREWCRRAYQGRGPMPEHYFHMFGDQELMEVAERHSAFWQDIEVIHYHDHWGRRRQVMPQFLGDANSADHWNRYKLLFESRKSAGFPGSEPIT